MATINVNLSGNGSTIEGHGGSGLPRYARNCHVQLTNNGGSAWTPDSCDAAGSPTFTLTGGCGSRIVRQQIHSATLASLWIDAGSGSGTVLQITDPQNAITCGLFVFGTFEELMVNKIEEVLRDSAGMQSVSMNGQSVTMQDLLAQRDMWLCKVNQQNGKRRRVSNVFEAFGVYSRGGRR